MHHSNCQVDEKVRTENDKNHEEDWWGYHAITILDVDHDGWPTFERGTLKDWEEAGSDVVKVGQSVV